jgi:hypothetical protein
MAKPRSVRRAGHVPRLGEERNAYNILIGLLQGNRPSDVISLDGKIILKLILTMYDECVRAGFDWSSKETDGGPL